MFGEYMWQRFCFTGDVEDYLVLKETELEEEGFLEQDAPARLVLAQRIGILGRGRVCGPLCGLGECAWKKS